MTYGGGLGLRRGLLAVTVLHGIDLIPDDAGAWLPPPAPLLIDWSGWTAALDGADPQTAAGQEQLAHYARARQLLRNPADVQPRPYAMPVGHPLHPGPAWVRSPVPGGVLDLGLGVAGLRPDPEEIAPLPPAACAGRQAESDAWYLQALSYLEQMAALSVARFARRPAGPLRPMGGCDVVTLLASATFRTGLMAAAAGHRTGMRTFAAPMRDRGWLDLRRIDPEFVACAAAATPPERRGFARPLLVTADELVLPGARSACSRPADPRDRPRSDPRS